MKYLSEKQTKKKIQDLKLSNLGFFLRKIQKSSRFLNVPNKGELLNKLDKESQGLLIYDTETEKVITTYDIL